MFFKDGDSPLHTCLVPNVARVLLENGAYANAVNSVRRSFIPFSFFQSIYKFVVFHRIFNCCFFSFQDGETPLISCGVLGGVDRAEILLQYGADPEIPMEVCSFLPCSSKCGYRRFMWVIQLLSSSSCVPDWRDSNAYWCLFAISLCGRRHWDAIRPSSRPSSVELIHFIPFQWWVLSDSNFRF